MRPAAMGLAWLSCLLVAGAARAEEAPFAVVEVPSPGRTAAAGIADLDGDGRPDLFAVGLDGVPPSQARELRVHFQRAGGALPGAPDHRSELPPGAAGFDVADLADGAGEELLVLHKRGVSVLSFAGRELARREIPFPNGQPTAALAPDERGLDRIRLARDGFAGGPLLLVPGLGELAVLAPDGRPLGLLAVGDRANYLIPPRPGALASENELEAFYDFPRIDTGDVDGDGRLDVLAANRHVVRVFLRREDGSFPAAPDLDLPLGKLTEKELIRSGSGNVRVTAEDFDGDGRADLLVSHTQGGFLDARSDTTLHLNRGGRWNLAQPDQTLSVEGRWNSWVLDDLDGDGRVELIEVQVPLSVLEVVELLATRALDLEVLMRRPADGDGGRVFQEEPWLRRKLDVGLSFETFEPKGFLPSVDADLNGDGWRDSLTSGDGERLEVALGGGDDPWSRTVASQPLDTTGNLRFGDFDGDGLTDFLLYDRTRPGTPIRLGVNRGVLPGTRRDAVLTPAAE